MRVFGAIIGVAICGLASLQVASALVCHGCSKTGTTERNIRVVQDLLDEHRRRYGAYPRSLDGLVLAGLVDKAPRDAWGQAFAYTIDGQLAVVTSRGVDGAPDISSNDL